MWERLKRMFGFGHQERWSVFDAPRRGPSPVAQFLSVATAMADELEAEQMRLRETKRAERAEAAAKADADRRRHGCGGCYWRTRDGRCASLTQAASPLQVNGFQRSHWCGAWADAQAWRDIQSERHS